ncbi:hypothetical protein F5Y03DRAFT_379077 [Xylaria venustula]|nr:hypothetical protein F5Y03DRAFT_379077 [Xylaria venustula]
MWWVAATPPAAFQLLFCFWVFILSLIKILTMIRLYIQTQANSPTAEKASANRRTASCVTGAGLTRPVRAGGCCMGQDRQPLANFILVVSVSTTRRPDSRDCLVLPDRWECLSV